MRSLLLLVGCLLLAAGVLAQEDVADVSSQDLRAGKDENKRYFLIGPAARAKGPVDGYGLILILPGGSGNADFHPFAKRIYKNAVPPGYVAAQPVAVKWTDRQEVVWPTAKLKAAGMKFTTEQFIEAVIDDVAARHQIDPARVFTLAWSSSGPAAYAISLTSKKVTGSLVAMSVFKPDQLPMLKLAKGHGYYLYHSPDDQMCPYRLAEQAEKELTKAGAKVSMKTYAGGHGWRGPLYEDIREGIGWLEKNHATPARR